MIQSPQFSDEALAQFSQWARERARNKAALMHPPSRMSERKRCEEELALRYYREYTGADRHD